VWRRIYQLAQERGVPVRPQNYDTRLVAGEWRRTSSARKNGVKYLAETMDRLSSDIRDARSRANAWATGDISALQALIEQDASYARSRAYGWPFLSDEDVQRLHQEAENQLLAAIERAINRNETTFAALPIHLLLGEQGVIARLRLRLRDRRAGATIQIVDRVPGRIAIYYPNSSCGGAQCRCPCQCGCPL